MINACVSAFSALSDRELTFMHHAFSQRPFPDQIMPRHLEQLNPRYWRVVRCECCRQWLRYFDVTHALTQRHIDNDIKLRHEWEYIE